MRWGAKNQYFQMIVMSLGEDPKKGRIPLSLVINCPGAVDIAYVIHRIAAATYLGW